MGVIFMARKSKALALLLALAFCIALINPASLANSKKESEQAFHLLRRI